MNEPMRTIHVQTTIHSFFISVYMFMCVLRLGWVGATSEVNVRYHPKSLFTLCFIIIIIIISLCVCMRCVHMCYSICVVLWESSSPSTMWILGIKAYHKSFIR